MKFAGSNLTPAEAFFWCSLLPVLSYLTATCGAILSVKEWNRKMKIQQRKRTVAIKNLRGAYISDQKTTSVYFKLRPLPHLITPLPNTLYTLFIFRVWGGHGTVPPPYAGARSLKDRFKGSYAKAFRFGSQLYDFVLVVVVAQVSSTLFLFSVWALGLGFKV